MKMSSNFFGSEVVVSTDIDQFEPGAFHQRADFLIEFKQLLKRRKLLLLNIHYRICCRFLFCLEVMLFSPASSVIPSYHWLDTPESPATRSNAQNCSTHANQVVVFLFPTLFSSSPPLFSSVSIMSA